MSARAQIYYNLGAIVLMLVKGKFNKVPFVARGLGRGVASLFRTAQVE